MSQDPDNLSSRKRAQGGQPPRFAGVRFGPTLATVLYVLLAGSAALALWGRGFPGAVPAQIEQAAPWVFLIFLVVFALYRFGTVRAGHYPAFKAFFQLGIGVLFFTLLLPGTREPLEEPSARMATLLSHPSPHVRVLAAEVTRHRPSPQRFGPLLVRALGDRSPEVRAEAHRSLVAIAGEDLGPPGDPEARAAWRRRFP